MPCGTERVIAGNTKTGRLIAVGPNTFIGERIGPKRTMESKRFNCKRAEIFQLWQAWRDEAKPEAFISVETRRTKPKQQTKPKPKEEVSPVAAPKQEPKAVYLLAFKGQRSSKPLAVYFDMGEAISMQDALSVALDVQGIEGEYTVDEIPVWPRKD